MLKHVLRNALIPILTNIAVGLPGIFVGSFLIEVFFSIPGLGREVLLAVNRSDYPVIQAFAIYIAVITMVVNLADRRALQAGRSARGAAMSAVIDRADRRGAPARRIGRASGRAAARRFRARPRRHRLARRRRAVPAARSSPPPSAWSASDWQAERGVPDAPPTLRRPRGAGRDPGRSPRRAGPNVDISASRSARAALQGMGRGAPRSTRRRRRRGPTTLPFGGDRLGRDVLAKAIKGAQISILVGVAAALLATAIGTVLGALRVSSAARSATSSSGSTTSSPPIPGHPADLRLRRRVRSRHRLASC